MDTATAEERCNRGGTQIKADGRCENDANTCIVWEVPTAYLPDVFEIRLRNYLKTKRECHPELVSGSH